MEQNNEVEKYKRYQFSSIEQVSTPKTLVYGARVSIGIALFFLGILFVPWQQNIKGFGSLTILSPQDRPQDLQSPIPGRIEKWFVPEGSLVKKGDTIVFISEVKDEYFDPKITFRLNEQIVAKRNGLQAIDNKINALNSQISALNDGLKLTVAKTKNKVKQVSFKLKSDSIEYVAAQTDNKIAKEQVLRQEKLYEQGLKSLTELESRRLKFQESTAKLISTENKLLTARNELINARIELGSVEAEYRDKIAKSESDKSSSFAYKYEIETEISKLQNKLSSVETRQDLYCVKAPQTGYLIKAHKQGIGENIKEGEAIATILPQNGEKAVELYVKAMDLPLLKPGIKVRLEFDGFPALQFSGWNGISVGTFGGKIAVIDNVQTEPSKYRILVIPDPDDQAWPEQLRVGSGSYGWAMLNDVPVWRELWRQLNGFPPDLPNVPSAGGSKKKS